MRNLILIGIGIVFLSSLSATASTFEKDDIALEKISVCDIGDVSLTALEYKRLNVNALIVDNYFYIAPAPAVEVVGLEGQGFPLMDLRATPRIRDGL